MEAEDAAANVASSPVPAAPPGGKRRRGERGPRRSEVSLLTLTPRSRGGPPIAGVLVSPRPLPPAAVGDAVALVTPAFDAVPLAPRRLCLRAGGQQMLSAPVLRSTMYNRVGEVVQLVAELAPTDDDRARMLHLLERRLWPERIAHCLEAETALQIVRNLRLALRAMPPSARDEERYGTGQLLLACAVSSESVERGFFSSVSELLDVDRRIVARAVELRRLLEEQRFVYIQRALPRRDNGGAHNRAPDEVITSIISFFKEGAKASPVLRDYREVSYTNPITGAVSTEVVLFTDQPDRDMFEDWVRQRLAAEPSLPTCDHKTWKSYRPSFIQPLTASSRDVCKSETDTQMCSFQDGAKAMSAACKRAGDTCPKCPPGAPGCGMNLGETFKNHSSMRAALLCPRQPGQLFYNIGCQRGSCKGCLGGAKALDETCPLLYAGAAPNDASWREFKRTRVEAVGDAAAALQVVETRQTKQPRRALMEKIKAFVIGEGGWLYFDFTAYHQRQRFAKALASLQPGQMIISADYAANFAMERFEELQNQAMQGIPHLKIIVACTWRCDSAGQIIRHDHYSIYDGRGRKACWMV